VQAAPRSPCVTERAQADKIAAKGAKPRSITPLALKAALVNVLNRLDMSLRLEKDQYEQRVEALSGEVCARAQRTRFTLCGAPKRDG
jgi:hypothetical protein